MVRATFSGFTTALSALQANQKRLDIIGQNLSNMNTPGYTRQQLETSSLNYTGPVSHYMNGSETVVGFGVSMDRVSQIRDPYLDAQYRAQMTKSTYTDSMQQSLDSLSKVLDESNMSGLRQAFDDIKATLKNMHDSSKVNDPVYESELRSRMQALSNLFNDASKQIDAAQKSEFEKLDGTGTSEQGGVQKVNDLLRQIGDLNRQIKQNQIFGQQSLELQDERNVLLDELSGYIPIEVSYYKDSDHSGTYTAADGTVRDKMYDYDSKGNVLGKKEWPDDLKVEMVYTDTDGATKRITLVNGTEGKGSDNYGSLSIAGGSAANPKAAALSFTEADSAKAGTAAASVTVSAAKAQLSSGSLQAGLDMLGKDGSLTATGTAAAAFNDVKGYQYYAKQLDTLASEFAKVMNDLNNGGDGTGTATSTANNLLADKTGAGGAITAANIGISAGWSNGSVHISSTGDSSNNTVLNMLKAMSDTYTGLGDKSFADFMNNVSAILANDSSSNTNALTTNVTVLNGIQGSKDSISGVSLDEEATNMMAYLSAYNAASRLMTALDEALQTLISGTGR